MNDVNEEAHGGAGGRLSHAYAALLRALWAGGGSSKRGGVTPRPFKRAVGLLDARFLQVSVQAPTATHIQRPSVTHTHTCASPRSVFTRQPPRPFKHQLTLTLSRSRQVSVQAPTATHIQTPTATHTRSTRSASSSTSSRTHKSCSRRSWEASRTTSTELRQSRTPRSRIRRGALTTSSLRSGGETTSRASTLW